MFFMQEMVRVFGHEMSAKFRSVKTVLAVSDCVSGVEFCSGVSSFFARCALIYTIVSSLYTIMYSLYTMIYYYIIIGPSGFVSLPTRVPDFHCTGAVR